MGGKSTRAKRRAANLATAKKIKEKATAADEEIDVATARFNQEVGEDIKSVVKKSTAAEGSKARARKHEIQGGLVAEGSKTRAHSASEHNQTRKEVRHEIQEALGQKKELERGPPPSTQGRWAAEDHRCSQEP